MNSSSTSHTSNFTDALRPHLLPVALLVAVCVAFWSRVLFTDQVLLPGAMLRGFAPFGSDAQSPWTILQWDALAQYYPWRLFAARQLQAGQIPLWNPHQFAGAPFLANGQSAVFYPLSLPFWFGDVARAFAISAFGHSLLAMIATYFLAVHWKCSRTAAVLAAIGFGLCGYLISWVTLPTLSNTASWLPLLLLLFERAAAQIKAVRAVVTLSLALCCALLAGHAQVFFYLVGALILRALFWPQLRRALWVLATSGILAASLAALQLLPTLELARLGHRAGAGGPSIEGWQGIVVRALQPSELWSLFSAGWPMSSGSLNENFPFSGALVVVLASVGIVVAIAQLRRFKASNDVQSTAEQVNGSQELKSNSQQSKNRSTQSQSTVEAVQSTADDVLNSPSRRPLFFCASLALIGLIYAMARPPASLFYFYVPGLSQMGGVGRALLWWNFGAAMLAAFGFDALRRRLPLNLRPISIIAPLLVGAELFAANWNVPPTAPRATIYPNTQLTDWLQRNVGKNERIVFVTPRKNWLPTEAFGQSERKHPSGVLPPNGAMVYGLNDIGGYDSLSPRAYREFVNAAEGDPLGIAPQLNGNIVLPNNLRSPALDALNVRYIVTLTSEVADDGAIGARVLTAVDGCDVWRRKVASTRQMSGSDFSPGFGDGKYQPQSFRFGAWISLCSLALLSALFVAANASKKSNEATVDSA